MPSQQCPSVAEKHNPASSVHTLCKITHKTAKTNKQTKLEENKKAQEALKTTRYLNKSRVPEAGSEFNCCAI